MAQTVRFATLEKFKANELRLLVCSDVAARGLDIGGLSHVFNFDVPIHAEDYVHRIGRTGRAGLEGHAFTIATPDDRSAVEAIEKLIGHPIPRSTSRVSIRWTGRRTMDGVGGGRGRTARPKAAAREKPPRTREGRSREAGSREGRLTRSRSVRSRRRSPARRNRSPRPCAKRRRRREPPSREPPRREPRRRDDDLGPAVTGFGEEMPAFMLLRRRSAQVVAGPSIEEGESEA